MRSRRVKRLYEDFKKEQRNVFGLGESLTENAYSFFANPYSMNDHVIDTRELNSHKHKFYTVENPNGRFKRFKAFTGS